MFEDKKQKVKHMKLTKTASGKRTLKLSKSEWLAIGKKAQWTNKPEGHGELHEEIVLISKMLKNYADQLSDLKFATDDIDNDKIQININDIWGRQLPKLKTVEGILDDIQSDLIQVDKMQQEWWHGDYSMPESFHEDNKR